MLANKTDETLPTSIAISGIPGGLEVRHDQLKELVKSGKIIPGTYSGPASRAYLYYIDEYKHWAPPLCVEITPKITGRE